ncbi:hypothetical protein D4740_08750 [Actinomyces sp. 2119]|nr:hypothetical protein D4740_08750 [Actinomyces sp. 2119]
MSCGPAVLAGAKDWCEDRGLPGYLARDSWLGALRARQSVTSSRRTTSSCTRHTHITRTRMVT